MAIPLHFQPSAETVRDYAEDAVRLTRQHYGFDLTSYQPNRLELVDFILDEWKSQGASVDQIGKTLYAFGAYAGEVLRNCEPGRWFKPEHEEDGDFGNYPFLAVRLIDGRVWKPVNIGFMRMIDGDAPGFHASMSELLARKA